MPINFNRISAIYYFHVTNDGILDSIKYLKSHDKLNSILIFADDGHISVKPYLDYVDYVPIIGRCLTENENSVDKDTPLVEYNLQSALYNSLLGCNDGFMNIDDIPIEKRLNHTYLHVKMREYNENAHIIDTFTKEDCKNWWHVTNVLEITDNKWTVDLNIYDDFVPIHLSKNNKKCYIEIYNMFPYILPENRDIVVAPWNTINDNFLEICDNMGIRYVIYSDVYDIKEKKNLGIPRINLERFV